jgi:2-polyprenyl-3-methyl-5-hydroxy-6-metoxy-1,4-benzoquinol methylase
MAYQDTLLPAPLTVQEIKRQIQRRVPPHYQPLPVDTLFRFESELAYRQDFLQLAVPPAGPSLRERLKHFFKKTFRLALRWVLIRQVEFNAVLLEHVRESSQLLTLVDRNLNELFAQVATVQRQLDAQAGNQQQMQQKLAQVNDVLIAYRVKLRRLHEPAANGTAPPTDAGKAYTAPPVDYLQFESQFRGAREEIAQRQRVYLPYFTNGGTVLDIGCGRGEFVELLIAEGIPALGVDANQDMVDYCQELALPVSLAEGTQHLDRLEDNSLGGIFCAQVVEHMPPEAILDLVGRCWAKLQKGGTLIVETVNPICPVANGNFYLDPTHVRPVHPELLRFCFESRRFNLVEYVFSSPVEEGLPPVGKTTDSSRFDATRYHDYAIVGRK